MNDILAILARDKNIKIYRPELNQITGSVTATLLLQQMIYWGLNEKGEAIEFYKFRAPCDHELYHSGDSWCEELGLTGHEFDTAIKKIGFKRGKSPQGQVPKDEDSALVIYYTDSSRITKYFLNVELLRNRVLSIYYSISKNTTKTNYSDPIVNEIRTKEVENEQVETNEAIDSYREWLEAKQARKANKGKWRQRGYGVSQNYEAYKKPVEREMHRGTLEDSLRDTLPFSPTTGCGPEIKALAEKLHVLKKDVYEKKLAYIAWVKSRPNDPSRWGLDMTAMVESFILKALASGEIEKHLTIREQLIAQGYEILGDTNE